MRATTRKREMKRSALRWRRRQHRRANWKTFRRFFIQFQSLSRLELCASFVCLCRVALFQHNRKREESHFCLFSVEQTFRLAPRKYRQRRTKRASVNWTHSKKKWNRSSERSRLYEKSRLRQRKKRRQNGNEKLKDELKEEKTKPNDAENPITQIMHFVHWIMFRLRRPLFWRTARDWTWTGLLIQRLNAILLYNNVIRLNRQCWQYFHLEMLSFLVVPASEKFFSFFFHPFSAVYPIVRSSQIKSNNFLLQYFFFVYFPLLLSVLPIREMANRRKIRSERDEVDHWKFFSPPIRLKWRNGLFFFRYHFLSFDGFIFCFAFSVSIFLVPFASYCVPFYWAMEFVDSMEMTNEASWNFDKDFHFDSSFSPFERISQLDCDVTKRIMKRIDGKDLFFAVAVAAGIQAKHDNDLLCRLWNAQQNMKKAKDRNKLCFQQNQTIFFLSSRSIHFECAKNKSECNSFWFKQFVADVCLSLAGVFVHSPNVLPSQRSMYCSSSSL